MNEELEKIYNLLDEAYDLENGKTKISLCEEAVRLADICGDEGVQIETRNELTEAAVFGGEHEKGVVAFSWMIQKQKETPELINIFDFLWKYKWILGQIYGFPNIPRSQLDAIFADAIECYTLNDVSLRPIYEILCYLEMDSGNDDKAFENYQKWQSAPRDEFANCLACEVSMQVYYQAFYENDERALEIAKPILKGKMKCAEVPHATYGYILMPLIKLKRFDEAEEIFNKGYKMVSKNKEFLGEVTNHLRFLTLANKTKNAIRLFEKHLVWALEIKQFDERFHFYNVAWLLFDKLESNGETSIKMRLPNSFKHYSDEGVYEISELKAELEKDLNVIAEMFDKRNGNEHFAGLVKQNRELRKYEFEIGK